MGFLFPRKTFLNTMGCENIIPSSCVRFHNMNPSSLVVIRIFELLRESM